MDIVRAVRDGKLTPEEAADLFDRTIETIQAGAASPDWRETFELTNHEATAVLAGASIGDLVHLRYEGWPERCSRCGASLDYLGYGWKVTRDAANRLRVEHITCPPGESDGLT
jgi:hypothetical protein